MCDSHLGQSCSDTHCRDCEKSEEACPQSEVPLGHTRAQLAAVGLEALPLGRLKPSPYRLAIAEAHVLEQI
eukprot:3935535-Amphidinium_carterae.1